MKVSQLIEQLSQYDQDAMVVVYGYEGGVNELSVSSPELALLNQNTSWYYGSHELSDEGDTTVVLLS